MLSGFLITEVSIDSKDRPPLLSNASLHVALRILPPYYLILILPGALRHAKLSYPPQFRVNVSNVGMLFGIAEDYGPLWSLGVAEYFAIFCRGEIFALKIAP